MTAEAEHVNADDLLRHLESLLFVAPEPAEISQLAAALQVTEPEVESALEELAERCKWRGIRVQRRGQRVQFASAPEAAPYVETFLGLSATTRLSQAALETLAIIAYRQPMTRAEIEVLRGVDCDGVLRTLTARQLITEVGRLETVGRPIRYGTTFEFLRYFGLERLEQLPSLQTGDKPAGAPGEATAAAESHAPAEGSIGDVSESAAENGSEAALAAQGGPGTSGAEPQAGAAAETVTGTGASPAIGGLSASGDGVDL